MRGLVVALLVGTVMVSGCDKQEEEAKSVGADAAKRVIQDPIRNARGAVDKAEKNNPVLLDTGSNIFHKTSCRVADTAVMETTTAGSALERGAKPDPACLPPR